MVIAAFAGAIYQVTSIWLEYFRYDVVVSKTFTYQRQAVFPAVTFCNMNPVKRSAVYNTPELSVVTSQRRRRRQVPEVVDTFHRPEQSTIAQTLLKHHPKHVQVLKSPKNANVEAVLASSRPPANDSEQFMQTASTANSTSPVSLFAKDRLNNKDAVLSRHKRSSKLMLNCQFRRFNVNQ
jgi:hypothetical protein